jgi:Mn-dependent DtxR family transcriptional regulator
MKKSLTKDELFLVKLFDLASRLKSPFETVDRYKVGQAIGQNDRSVDNIVRMLAQANFIKKAEGNSIYLTESGVSLVKSLHP